MTRNRVFGLLMATTILGTAAHAEDVTLTIESWRNDDLAICRKRSSRPLRPRTPVSS